MANAGIGNNYAAAEQAKTAASMDPSNSAYRNLVQQLSYGTYRYDSMSENYGGQRGREAAVPILSLQRSLSVFQPFRLLLTKFQDENILYM